MAHYLDMNYQTRQRAEESKYYSAIYPDAIPACGVKHPKYVRGHDNGRHTNSGYGRFAARKHVVEGDEYNGQGRSAGDVASGASSFLLISTERERDG